MFFDEFFHSSEELFLTKHEKKYFVFTDGHDDLFNHQRVLRTHQAQLGWPYDTLKRFHMFCSIEEGLNEMDFLFFFNANMKFLKTVGEEVIPGEENDWFVGVNHPGYCTVGCDNFPYERKSESTAYIAPGRGNYYFQGCLFGGRTKEFVEMAKELSRNIDQDEEKNIMAQWHDESHLNHYFLHKKPRLLDPSYAYPESLNIPYDRIIIQIDKSKLGGHDYLRGLGKKKTFLVSKIGAFLKSLISSKS